ncbi:FAD-dependent oxidoreductase [Smaragdicoccus niigatensis]|uniref:FAD-dependent oxidoreductase n=1 Tax=Smaragdicoccus niigatensis TaxID=359359 RepID=UPI0009DB8241|nr:FAD-dependent oxidoreductase [Smaragdicoccus niigatensis]
MYAAKHLLAGFGGKGPKVAVEVDMLDRLPTPYGLIRHGVAPDHPEKKKAASVFDEVADFSGFRFFGNLELGRDVKADELAQWYDAVIYATGASGDAHLEIPGEDLTGSLSAREFVAWYNGHPDFNGVAPDLSGERAVVVGNGNVAMDVARILSTDPDVLAKTDISDTALAALRNSRIREVVVLGRRDAQHAAFKNPELEEFDELNGVDIVVEGDDLAEVRGADATTARKLDTLRRYAKRGATGNPRRIVLRFLASPVEVRGEGHVDALVVGRNRLEPGPDGQVVARPSGETKVIETGLVLRAVGYFGTELPGLPFDASSGTIPNREGRVVDGEATVSSVYVTGWAKRGPQGIIGTNKKCARDTVRSFLADATAGSLHTAGTLSRTDVEKALRERQSHVVDIAGWRRIDDVERTAGRSQGRPRVKLSDLGELLRVSAG